MNSEPQPVYVAAPARVPQGLAAAVEGLTREVIRQQPDNIYMFAAQHFDKLLRLRQQYDNCGGGGNQASPGIRGDNYQSRAQEAAMQATSKQTQTKSTMTKKSYMTTTTCMTTSRTTTTLKSNSSNNGNDACTATRLSKIPQATSGVGGGGYETTKEYSKEMTSRKCTTSNNNQAWSLDETAKVLERHRSIFGISGQKMSTEEVRELASKEQQQQQQQSQQRVDRHYACKYGVPQPSRGPNAHQQTSSKVVSQDYQSSCIRHSRHSPKIISQIPLARDMKTELRRNRQRNCDAPLAASHCRIASSSCSRNEEYRHSQHHHHHHHRERSGRGHHGSCERIDSCGSRCRNYEQATRRPCKHTQTSSKKQQQQQQQQPNFLVRNLGSMPSLEELQPPSYLRRVQQVVDETSTPLRQKIEALKVNQSQGERVGGGRIGSIERSFSTEDEPFRSDGLQLFDRHRHPETIGKGTNGKNVLRRSASTQSLGRSSSNYGYRSDESKISLPIVSASNGNVHGQQQSGAHPSAATASAAASSLQSSRSVSAHSNSEAESHADVVLPPISPESSKSQKLPDEQLVLPTLPTPQGSGGSDKDMDLDEDDDDEEDRQIMELLRVNNEEDFKDSLNVTPDPRSVAPQRPDSLETSDLEDDARQRDNEADEPASPVDTLKGKLLEIEQVSKRIESVLVENNKNELASNNAKSKLIDDYDSSTENLLLNDDIKKKLELEDVERRIDGIFVAGGGGAVGAGTVKSHKGYVIQDKDSGVQGSVASEPSFDKRQESHESSCSGGESARNEDAVSPSSYILTEGSPCDIPDSVITVIIPDNRPTSPDSDVCTQIEYDNPDSRLRQRKEQQQQQQRTENESRANSAVSSSGNASEHVFGELIDHRGDTELAEAQLATGSDIDFLRAIKANHDELVARQELSLIREEDNNRPDSDDEKVLRVVTSSLEDILEDKQQEPQEVVAVTTATTTTTTATTTTAVTTTGEYESTDETKESSMTTDGLVERTEEVVEVTSLTTGGSVESSNEFKETSATTDRSSLSLDPAMPYVPELNLDSLPDLTSSSIVATTTDDDEQAANVSPDTLEKSPSDDNGDNNDDEDDNNDEEQVEIEEYEKLEQSLKSPPAIDESNTDVIQASEAVVHNNVNDATIVVDVEHRNADDDEKTTTTTISENRRTSASDDCTTRTAAAAAAASTTITTTITAMTSAAVAVTATQRMQRAATSQNDDDDLSSSATTAAATTAATEIENNNICNESSERQQQSSSQRTATDAAATVEDISIKSKIDTENERGESSSAQLAEATGRESLQQQQQQLASLSITETSSFIHAVTKIQSGVRGFLARRRAFKLQHQQQQRSECRSSTLDSVPSIQESFVADAIAVATATAAVAATAAAIETSFVGIVDEIDDNAPTSGNHNNDNNNKENNKASKKRLTREDAVMRTTLSVENAFAENQLQHTGEFHDCIPLPVFGADDLDLKIKRPTAAAIDNAATPAAHVVQELLGKLLQADAALLLHATTAPTVRPVDPLLHAGYLNFITSVEDMGHVELPTMPTSKGVVIEEITGTSLDDEQILRQLDDTTGSQVSNEDDADSSSNVIPCRSLKQVYTHNVLVELKRLKVRKKIRGEESVDELAKTKRIMTELPKSSSSEELQQQQQSGADKAATKIQAGFRGYQVRKKLHEQQQQKPRRNSSATINNQLQQLDNGTTQRQGQMEAKQQHQREQFHRQHSYDCYDGESSGSESLEDKSATVIQARVRGFLVRRRRHNENEAATKIQARFRGFRTRKLLKQTGQ
ncbi:unnamed protein product [Trichogramma brassicae]|uniref:RIIa domain-containing protein n=1 Tax=Trichogramma brassicae TaxID=86971 RepID=A0A6H5I4G2_9HYME|nr:unnamed protein product [Trichogramma brassicae]